LLPAAFAVSLSDRSDTVLFTAFLAGLRNPVRFLIAASGSTRLEG
jgi:hypothetical protein